LVFVERGGFQSEHEHARRILAERVMGSVFAVLTQPVLGDLAHLFHRSEQVGVQHLGAVCPVEPLDIGVLVGLARFDVVQRDALARGTFDEVVAAHLRPPFSPETMLRIHFMQQSFALSDSAMEEALHDMPCSARLRPGSLGRAELRIPVKLTPFSDST
jgi:hypothetical protein